MLLKALVAGLALCSGTAHASPETTRDAMERLEELLELRIEDGRLTPEQVMPALLVSAQPLYADSEAWFTTRAIEVVERSFGGSGLRICEACMAPRAFVDGGALTYQTGPVALEEIVRLDEQSRGDAQPARSAIWIDEHRGGVSVRIVDLRTSRVLYAQNVDPTLVEYTNTQRMYTLSEELERRARGDSTTQAFVDFALYPGQHLSLDWTDQWGPRNASLSGVTVSLFDPVIGIGAVHYQRVEFLNILVGAKGIVSLPTAVAASFDAGSDVIDPLLTGVLLTRVPFGRSNYGALVTASTNGQFGIGISLMNIRLLPVLL